MTSIFPESIQNLPEADIPFEGVKAFLSQGENYQIIFMEFEKDVDLSEHSHESQWEVIVEGNPKGESFEIKRIKYRLLAGSDIYVPPGTGLREQLDEPEGMLTPFWILDMKD